jgi:hypothetical protein
MKKIKAMTNTENKAALSQKQADRGGGLEAKFQAQKN